MPISLVSPRLHYNSKYFSLSFHYLTFLKACFSFPHYPVPRSKTDRNIYLQRQFTHQPAIDDCSHSSTNETFPRFLRGQLQIKFCKLYIIQLDQASETLSARTHWKADVLTGEIAHITLFELDLCCTKQPGVFVMPVHQTRPQWKQISQMKQYMSFSLLYIFCYSVPIMLFVPSCTGNPLFTVSSAWLLSLRDASPLQGTRLHKEDYKFVLTKQFTITHFKCLLDIVLLYTFSKVAFQRQ